LADGGGTADDDPNADDEWALKNGKKDHIIMSLSVF
jgi:hypothetical protein